jgi:hypothetical protein
MPEVQSSAMKLATCIALIAGVGLLLAVAGRSPEIPFEKHTIDLGASETSAVADINGDGQLDIVSGEFWYAAPGWTPHRFRELNFVNPNVDNYIDNFSDLALDVDSDSHTDIVSSSWFARKLIWLRNPGKGRGTWTERPIESGHNVEFAFLVDLDNDGKAREVLPQFGGQKSPLTWYEAKDGAFIKHVVSPSSYGHGIGAGDVNGDGRNDIITPKGWFEAPADVRNGQWTMHADFDLGGTGFIYAQDVNGDGRNDLVTSMAHDYGVFWMERGDGNPWTKRLIDDTWSQAHAMTLIDLNNDGRRDLVTGKRYMAHARDPGAREPLGLYWY